MIAIHAWTNAGKTHRDLSADDLLNRKDELLAPDTVVWIDMCAPTEAEESLVFQQFYSIHPLSLEDITRLRREPDAPPHLPKVEEFPDYLFVIVNPLAETCFGVEPAVTLTQLSAVLTERILITHHAAPMKCIDIGRAYVARHEGHSQRGPDFLFHLILDDTVDEFVPVLDQIEDTLEEHEATIMQRPTSTAYLHLLRLKRVIIVLRKTLIAEREVLIRLARGEFALVDERETVYYRNVYDHLVRFTELIETSREMASDLMQTYLSAQSNHLNQIMKVLTMISTIVLPMTLIAGVYGMNFDLLVPDSKNDYGFFIANGLMILSGVVSVAFFYWRRWL